MISQQNTFIRNGNGDPDRLKVWIDSIALRGGSVIEPEKNGVTAIVGANNSGKSTLLSSIHMAMNPQYGGDSPLLERAASISKEGTRDDLIEWLDRHARWGPGQHDSEVAFRRMNLALPGAEVSSWDRMPPRALFWTHYFPADGYGGYFGSERIQAGRAPEAPTQVLYEQPALRAELDKICLDVFGEHLTLDDESPQFSMLVGKPEVHRPGPDDDRRPYRDAIGKLPPLHQQGHGMRSWLTVITQLLTGTYPIILADEPEVFLHPPQARALGIYLSKLARSKHCQVIVATHDRNLLSGLLEAGSDLTVVRLERTPRRTFAHQLPSAELRTLWSDPLLRYGNALDGLFHRAVVVAEAHGDCTFYQAALDHMQESARPGDPTSAGPEPSERRAGLAASDVMFAPSNGKHAMPKLARALSRLQVPVVVTPDLDVLNPSEPVLRRIVEAVDGDWSRIEKLHRQATNSLTAKTALNDVSHIRRCVDEEFETLLQKEPQAIWTTETRKAINEVLRAAAGPSERLKHEGTNYASGDELKALQALLAELHRMGIFPVEVGELERFAREFNQNNKTVWLEQALAARAYERTQVQDHIGQLLTSAQSQGNGGNHDRGPRPT